MKRIRIALCLLISLAGLAVLLSIILIPWMDRWGATNTEISSSYPGDELLPDPRSYVNRAVTINATPKDIFPWLLQIGADKGGWYSYAWLENMLSCPITNADRIHSEWQNLKVGDAVPMCPGDFGPPAYITAQIIPDQAIVLGHQDQGVWVDIWQFILVPESSNSTRLILRTRTMMTGGIWDVIHPGVFIMERGMLHGIKTRSESSANEK
jgi:hypothetical protein